MISAEDQGSAGYSRETAEDAGKQAAAGEALKGDAEADAGHVQRGGGEDEADREGKRPGATEFAAMGMAVEEGEDADDRSGCCRVEPHRHGNKQAECHHRGEDRRLDEGQADTGNRQREARAIIATKAAGTTTSARPPICAAQRPTATMTRIWSSPNSGCEKPAANEPCSAGLRWAKAGAAEAISAAVAIRMRLFMRVPMDRRDLGGWPHS